MRRAVESQESRVESRGVHYVVEIVNPRTGQARAATDAEIERSGLADLLQRAASGDEGARKTIAVLMLWTKEALEVEAQRYAWSRTAAPSF